MTYMHVDHLAITFLPTDDSRHEYQGVLWDEVADTSLGICIVTRMSLKIEFKPRRQRKNDGENDSA